MGKIRRCYERGLTKKAGLAGKLQINAARITKYAVTPKAPFWPNRTKFIMLSSLSSFL